MNAATAERLSRGEDVGVDVAAIEREFAALWRSAGGEGPHQAVTRACLANLVVWCESDEQLVPLKQAFDELVLSVPARVIILQAQAASTTEKEFECYISANCILAPGGGKLVCSEEVTLLARGTGVQHLASVVRALLVSNVPTMLLVTHPPTRAPDTLMQLVPMADRLLIDTGALGSVVELTRLLPLLQKAQQTVDLGWMGLGGIRACLASVFDHREPRAALQGMTQVVLHTPAGREANRVFMLGWLGEKLHWSRPPVLEKSTATSHSVRQGPLSVVMQNADLGPDGREADTVLEMHLAGQDVKLSRGVDPCAVLETIKGVRRMALDPATLGERIARAMGPRAFDPLFGPVLERTVELLRVSGQAS